MGRRGRLALAAAVVVAALFFGRWAAGVAADRWWAEQFGPAQAALITELHLLRLVLDAGGILVASTWFIGHLLLVVRGIASVQVARSVANLEIREALPARTLLLAAVAGGAVLGAVAGADASRAWPDVALAWEGVRFGVREPLLGEDAGTYVAQLPVWRLVHAFVLALAVLALVAVATLYAVIGALRWRDGRIAVNDHARAHLGWLLAAVALGLAWGALLAPYEWVGGLLRGPTAGGFRAVAVVAPALGGLAVAAAVASLLWGLTGRRLVLLAAWSLLAVGWFAGRVIVPVAAPAAASPLATAERERLVALAYALEGLHDATVPGAPAATARPAVPTLWSAAAAAQAWRGGAEVVGVDPAVLDVPGRGRRPAWLGVAIDSAGRATLGALADDRVGRGGGALFWAPGDTAPGAFAPLASLPAAGIRPGSTEVVLLSGATDGVPVGGWFRRIPLAWALQAPRVLGTLPPDARLAWHLAPLRRLARLAPFAEWGAPVARVIDGDLAWVATGYLSSDAFPLSERVAWRGRDVGAVRPAFTGVVRAATGQVRLFLRPDAGPLGAAWARVARGVVEPAAALPPAVARQLPYPLEQFRLQATVVGPLRGLGRATGVGDSLVGGQARVEFAWARDTSGPVWLAPFERESDRHLAAVLVGSARDGREDLALVRTESPGAVPGAALLAERWSRFPSFTQLRDSVADAQGTLEAGPLRLWLHDGAVGAYQVQLGRRDGAPVVAWVAIAAGERLGAGRTLEEAWDNLRGTAAPLGPARPARPLLDELRRLARAADSALRAGDLGGFGRQWEQLRLLLDRAR
ncbi:MAG: UPF0182 family protein [Gemmatimonadales bacterium]|nr:UPF0182 family protein [Gemmatimonadales bacterium]